MRNRAKCKLCEDIIESKHRHDYVSCKCGQISVDGGQDYWRTFATDYVNFLRIEDDGTVKEVVYIEKEQPKEEVSTEPGEDPPPRLTKTEKLDMLKGLLDAVQNVPLDRPITHYDYHQLLLLVISLFQDDTA